MRTVPDVPASPWVPSVEHAAVLLATGTSYRRLGVPGEDELIGSGLHFCATCDGPFYRGAEELLVIGGGNAGAEEGLFLAQFAERIRLVEFMPELSASARLRDIVRSNPCGGVGEQRRRLVEVVEREGPQPQALRLDHGDGGPRSHLWNNPARWERAG